MRDELQTLPSATDPEPMVKCCKDLQAHEQSEIGWAGLTIV
jgi:hypothetical protein